MPARHDDQTSGGRRWAPTALDAVVAATPTTSLFAALGLAGGGYLVGREGVAACGAVVGAFGLVVERYAARGLRVRLRRERQRHRSDLQGVSEQLRQLQRELQHLRDDLNGVRSERDAAHDELQAALNELSTARTAALGIAPLQPPVVHQSVVPQSVVQPPVGQPAPVPPAQATSAAGTLRSAFAALLPGQVRSPIATGGIPVLEPGPTEPVPAVIDLRTPRSIALPFARPVGGAQGEPITEPLHTLPPEAVDALVYAALAEADADELTRTLEVPGAREVGRHAGALHTGDAHHAGDYARGQARPEAAATLLVVKRGRHAA